MRFAIVYFLIHMSILSYAQMRPLPAVLPMEVCFADDSLGNEPDIHCRIPEVVIKQDTELLKRIDEWQTNVRHLDAQNMVLKLQLEQEKEQRRLEKKYAGIAGLLLFASGNEMLKNVGLVGLFAYSIW